MWWDKRLFVNDFSGWAACLPNLLGHSRLITEVMLILTKYSLQDEQSPNGELIRVMLVETENPTVQESIDGTEHPLDWNGARRTIDNEVATYRARGEHINLVGVIGVRDDNHVTEWSV
jgi:hypothetical protein